MGLHRRPRAGGIGVRDAIADRAVLVARRAPARRRLEIAREAREVRIDALIEQIADDVADGVIGEHARDREMKRAVGRDALWRSSAAPFMRASVASIPARSARRGRLRGLFGDRPFEQRARREDLERTCQRRRRDRGRFLRGEHIDARPDPDPHASVHLERDQGFAHRRPRNAELRRELALGRQAVADGKLAAVDQLAELVRHLTIEPARLDA